VGVAGVTAKSTTNFTFVAGPTILSVTPQYLVSGANPTTVSNFTVNGLGLTGATFSFLPAFTPAPITVNSATVNSAGNSATLSLTIAAGTLGSFSVVAANGAQSSSLVATTANTLQIITPDGDADGDGLTNAVEIAIGTNPLNAYTSGDGLPDGWQVFFGLNPLDPTVAGQDPDKSGLTILQDFQMGLSPVNPNRVPPAVAQITPKNGLSPANINGVVVARFTEPLMIGVTQAAAQTAIANALGENTSVPSSSQQIAFQTLQSYLNRTCCGNSVVSGTVTLTGPLGGVTGTVTPSNDGLSATFSTPQPLPANTPFTVQVNGVRDAAGNLMTTPFTSTFTTGTAAEFTQPTVALVDPENNSSNVPTNVHYTVQFSKAIDPSTLTPANFSIIDRNTNLPVPGMVQADADGITASFIPNPPLPVADSFYVTLSTNIKDIYGNNLVATNAYYFSTTDTPETAALQLVANSPANGATGLGTNALVNLQFNEAVDIATVVPNITVTAAGAPVAVMMAESSGDQRVTITPTAAFAPNTKYTVNVGAGVANLTGTALANPASFSFTTGTGADATTPSVVSVNPANGSTSVPTNTLVSLGFSKPVDATTLNSAHMELYPSAAGGQFPVAGIFVPGSGSQSVTFTPASPLVAETQYCFYITGIVDADGNSLQGQGNVTCFTTGAASATTGPTVVSMSPVSGSTAVPLNALVSVAFSEPISATGAGGSAIQVTAGKTVVAGSISAVSGATTLTFTPTNPLAANTVYTVQVSGVTDLAGNTVVPFTGNFTTATSTALIVLSTGLNASGNLIATGDTPDAHWVVTPTATTPAPGTFSATGATKQLLVAVPGQTGYSYVWPADGPNSSWIAIDPDSVTGNTFGVYSTKFTVPGTSVPPNLCLVGSMGVDDEGQLGINGKAIMSTISSESALTALNIPVSSFLVPGVNTLSLGWGPTDNSYEAFRLQAAIESCGASAVAGALSVASVTPAQGATGVAVNSTIAVTFSEPVNPLTVNDLSVNVQANGETLAGSYAVNGAAVTFTPLTQLPANATVYVTVDYYGAVQDYAGNTGQYTQTGFTTATTADTAPPTVVSVTPVNGATNIGLNGQVAITFSKSMNRSTLTSGAIALLAEGQPQGYDTSVSADNRTVVLYGFSLPASTVITVAVPHTVTDLSGNGVKDFTSQFTTGAAIDTSHAAVVSQRPANGATNVSVGASPIVLFMNAPLNASTVTGAMHVAQNGQPIAGAVSVTGNGQTIEFTPAAPMQYGSVIQVFLDASAEDSGGNAISAYQGTFNTAGNPATTAPEVVNYTPSNQGQNVPLNTVVDLSYSEPVTAATVNATDIDLNGPNGAVAATVSLDSTGTMIHLVPSGALTANSQYCLLAQNIVGTNGLAAPSLYACFTTGSSALKATPTMLVSPANGLSNVPLNANVRLRFNQLLDTLTVNAATVQLSGGGQGSIPASISFAFNPATATNPAYTSDSVLIATEAPLPASTPMTLVISGITDVAGNPVAPETVRFTTGTAPETTNPAVIAENPAANATNVPINAAISLQANAAIDPTTVNGSSFLLQDNTLNAPVNGSYSESADGTTVYFVPTSPLAIGRSFSLYYSSRGMTDLAGDLLNSCCNYSFTTGFNTVTAPLQVTGISPAKGTAQVPINAQIVVEFNGPVNPATAGAVTLSANGNAVPLSATPANGNQTLTLLALPGLLANTTYTLTVSGVTDQSGNALSAPVVSTFTTSAEGDFVAPTVVLGDPANNSSGIPLNTLVRLAFSKQVDAATLSVANVILYPAGVSLSSAVAGSLAVAPGGQSVTLTPASPLITETQYCVYVNGVVDLEGHGLQQNGQNVSCFTTGASKATSAPTATSVSPVNGATAVPVNAIVEIGLSAPISAVSAASSDITLTSGGQAVAGSISVGSGNTTIAFTPSAPLAVSAPYTLQLMGLTDLAGNAVAAFTSKFTTSSSATADAGPLQVTGSTPGNGATKVPVNSTISVTFNEPVNPLTVNALSVNVQANSLTLAGSYRVSGSTVTFTPATPLPGNATVSITVNYFAYVQDLAGNNGQVGSGSFTTASAADTSMPSVVSVTPVSGATGIGLNGQVAITFSSSMNRTTLTNGSIELLAGDQSVGYYTTVSSDNTTVVLYGFNLPASTVITVAVPHTVTDILGNPAADFTSQFTTGATVDTSHASVVTQRPGNGATNIAIGASPIVLFVDTPLIAATVQGALQVSQNGQTVPGTVSVTGNGQTIEFTPSAPWQYGALIQVFLNPTAEDTSGKTVTAYQGSFTTITEPSATAPTAVNFDPFNGATGVPLNTIIDAGYNETLASSTVNATNVFLNGPSGPVSAKVSLDSTGTVIQMKPSAALTASSEYCFYIRNVLGTNGLAVQSLGSCFTTGTAAQTKPATVAVVSPQNGLSGVPLNAGISLAFTTAIDTLSVTGTTVKLSGGGQTAIPASISFTNNDQTVRITPQAPLPPSTAMTLAVSGVTDLAGNPVTALTTHFTTGTTAATAAPYVIAANPVNATPPALSDVPVNTVISLETTAPIDATTLNSYSFEIYDTTTGQALPGTYSESSDARTVYFVPSAVLAANRTYYVYFTNRGIADIAGNVLSTCCGSYNNFGFTTGPAGTEPAPKVTAVSPKNGAAQIPINAQMVVAFSEPVDAASLGEVSLTANGTAIPVGPGLYDASCQGDQATTGAPCAVLSSGNTVLTITPAEALLPTTLYKLTVAGVTNLSGAAMSSPVTSSFTTGTEADLTGLNVVSVTPANGSNAIPLNAQIQVVFNKPADTATLGSGTLSLTASGTATALTGALTYSADGTTVVFKPAAALAAATQYCSAINGVVDLEGHGLAQNGQNITCFTTGQAKQTTSPTVIAVSPANASTGVSTNTSVAVALSAPISTPTAGPAAIALKASGTAVAGSVASSGTTVLFTPAAPLAVNTAYGVTVSGVTDLYGNPVTPFSSAFTTGTLTSQTVNYSAGFPSALGLSLNGSAQVNSNALELTDGNDYEAASAWYGTPVGIANFTSSFTFQMVNPSADGFTFAIQNAGPTALGDAGGYLGYSPIPTSFALKFDIYNNEGEGTDSIGVYTGGAAPELPATDLTGSGIVLTSGHTFKVTLAYSGTSLKVTILDTKTNASCTNTFAVDIPTALGSNTGYIGFTGGTGIGTVTTNILNWTFSAD